MRNEPQIAIVKLAAIGDVVIACRALSDFMAIYEAPVTFHWIIDHRLEALAKAMMSCLGDTQSLQNKAKIKWHPIDSGKLFKGTAAEKAREALDLYGMIRRIQPVHIALLHRDWRYKLLLRPAFRGSLLSVRRQELNELDAYAACLNRLASVMGLKPRPTAKAAGSVPVRGGGIGLLIGGAQNQKLTFHEKRWPHLRRFLELVLGQTGERITLFGGPDDANLALAMLDGLPHAERVENLVGKLKLQELPPKIQTLDAFVSIDSGLAHIAATLMTARHQKVITLFGPTNPKVWAPKANGSGAVTLMYKNKSCSPCYLDDGNFKPCTFAGEQFQHCMTDISAEEVMKALSS